MPGLAKEQRPERMACAQDIVPGRNGIYLEATAPRQLSVARSAGGVGKAAPVVAIFGTKSLESVCTDKPGSNRFVRGTHAIGLLTALGAVRSGSRCKGFIWRNQS